MKTPLQPGEHIVKQGRANLQKSIETVGGRLYLTNFRLVFEAHRLNVQGGETALELSDVQSTGKCWTRFLGIVPMIPNSVAVRTRQGDEFRYVVSGRGAWIDAIDAQTTARRGRQQS